jgi:hypothetical protein
LTFDPVSLNGVIELTIHGLGRFLVLNITLTGQNLNLKLNSDLHFQQMDTPFTIELPLNITLDVFEHHYLPPLPTVVAVTIQGIWTLHGLSFPMSMSQTTPLEWCVASQPFCPLRPLLLDV